MTARMSESQFSAFKGRKPRANYTLRIPKRVDANQPDIVKTLRKLGFMVHHLHEVGEGLFDLLCAKHGLNILVEVKDGAKVPSARKLTDPQKRFHFAWTGMRCVVTNDSDCLRLNNQMNHIGQMLRQAGITLTITGSEEAMYQPGLH